MELVFRDINLHFTIHIDRLGDELIWNQHEKRSSHKNIQHIGDETKFLLANANSLLCVLSLWTMLERKKVPNLWIYHDRFVTVITRARSYNVDVNFYFIGVLKTFIHSIISGLIRVCSGHVLGALDHQRSDTSVRWSFGRCTQSLAESTSVQGSFNPRSSSSQRSNNYAFNAARLNLYKCGRIHQTN